MAASHALTATAAGIYQPNAFERKQVELAVKQRARYLYVSPKVFTVHGGFRVESPCCSRRVDVAGGVVDIALIQSPEPRVWELYHKDHAAAQWVLHKSCNRLCDLLDELKMDPEQKFWQ